MRQEYANHLTSIYRERSVQHPENGECYTFHITTGITAWKDSECSGVVAVFVHRGAQCANLGTYQVEKMPAFSLVGLLYGHAQGLSNWLSANTPAYLIQRAQYGLKHQAGPVVSVNSKGFHDGPLLHDQMGVYYEAN